MEDYLAEWEILILSISKSEPREFLTDKNRAKTFLKELGQQENLTSLFQNWLEHIVIN